jgi:hypothetical protein
MSGFFFCSPRRSDRIWLPHKFLCSWNRDQLPRVKWRGPDIYHSPPFSTKVKYSGPMFQPTLYAFVPRMGKTLSFTKMGPLCEFYQYNLYISIYHFRCAILIIYVYSVSIYRQTQLVQYSGVLYCISSDMFRPHYLAIFRLSYRVCHSILHR